MHDSKNKRLLPESFGAAANCNKCKQTIDDFFLDALSNLYKQEYDNAIETDMAQLEIVCENCGYINSVDELIFDHDVEINNQYFQFIAIEANFNMAAVDEIGKRLGCNLKVFYDRF